jgi:hypothetical protein
MKQQKIVQKLRDLLEMEVAAAEQQVVRDPLLKDYLIELLKVQQFVQKVELQEVPQIYG